MTVLLCSAISACTTVKTVYERPVCTPAALPPLPTVTADELANLPPATYWKLETRERLITDWALENEVIIHEVCDAP